METSLLKILMACFTLKIMAETAAECGGKIEMSPHKKSYVQSPSLETPLVQCEWEIQIPFGNQLEFSFEHFLLPTKFSNCDDVFFEIEDLTGVNRFCQSGPSERSYVAFGSKIRARLFSLQTRDSDDGIRALVHYSEAPCHGDLTNFTYGTIYSPYYPEYYPNDFLCTWKLRVPENFVINVDCTDYKFWIENSVRCQSDVLLISQSGRDDFADGVAFCGRRPPLPFTSFSNTLTFLFKSNPFYHYNGFRCDLLVTPRSVSSTTTLSPISTTTLSPIFPTIPTEMPPPDPNACGVCGIANDQQARVFGGFEPKPNQYPWIVAIFERVANSSTLRQICGGSMLNDRYVVSAAHCFRNKVPDDIAVDLGEHNIRNANSSRIFVNASQLIINPGFGNGASANNDIAVVKLSRSVPYTASRRPICLPPAGYSFVGLNVTVAGWGRTRNDSNQSNAVLMAANVQVVPLSGCQNAFGSSQITQNMICAIGNNPRRDACPGDSGGPLMLFAGDRWYLIGVVSAGDPGGSCGNPNYPGIYTRVGNYLEWIGQNIQADSNCSAVSRKVGEKINAKDSFLAAADDALSPQLSEDTLSSKKVVPFLISAVFVSGLHSAFELPVTTLKPLLPWQYNAHV